ncbi:MAG: long-chain fatty acid--CoA ligase [Myxococcales bacterium]|nr:long-chain fatty acid--CoA ligase [Myxococcales bacterium]
MTTDTIPLRLFARTEKTPYSPAYYIKEGGRWKPTNWRTYGDEVRDAGKSLMSLGVGAKGAVSILGFNRPEWVIFNLGAMSVGAYAAGVYTTCSPEEVQYIVNHAEASVMLVENKDQADKVAAQRENLPHLEQVVAMKGAGDLGKDVLSWEDFLTLGEDVKDADFDEAMAALEPGGLATLIYTSGTTGPPKGVMLTHENLAWTASQLASTMDSREGDCVLSFLPLSHIAEQMVTIHGPITFGGAAYYAESIAAVPDNLKEVQPTIFFAVPRLWEKFHAKLSSKLSESTGVKEHLIKWVRGVCTEVSSHRNQGSEIPFALEMQYKLANKLVLDKLKPALGLSRARFCLSGAAPISKEILDFFASIDIIVHEVYGQSEDTGPTTLNLNGRTKLGSVGPAIPGVEVKIAEDGEIIVRGKNVCAGYFKDEAATNETFKDGWMHSGDLGEFDSQGFLNITGRKKDIIITAGGKNVAPKNIEASLKDNRIINEAVVIGDRRKYLTALVTLDEEAVGEFLSASKNGDELPEDPAIMAEVKSAFEKTNSTLAQVEIIKKWTILPRNLTIEDGELTPTLKVKRNKVNENFSSEIESMY